MRTDNGTMISFSKRVKGELSSIVCKKKCCARVTEDMRALLFVDDHKERCEIIRRSADHFKCEGCFHAFVRGMFIFCGNVTEPSKQYHLELSFESCEERDITLEILNTNGFTMSETQRRGRFILYIKSSEKIQDFFAVIGANNLTFDLINAKIVKEVRGQANRQMNCDMANIKRIITTSQKYIDAIEFLKSNGGFDRLSSDLRETASLKYDNVQSSMSELAAKHNPPISKPGVKHRLDKILAFAQKEKDNLI